MYTWTWKVRTGDTDFSGRVYTPEVINYIARAMEDLLDEVGFSPGATRDRGLVYPVVHAEADYFEQVRVQDDVVISMEPDVGTTSITFDAVGERDGETVFEGSLTIAFADFDTGESAPVPDDLRTALDAQV